ncbi:hypothetical protein ASPACDRAFT_47442 [Aspergillus aculeatus ATCC 16872]|uniref:Uncharacterized protein n=1 Tax=Aspergillus aculeatus (strain ATCC 16872 / CBS 172.66 / WB 5094) TaxID=690307 RepID=A0A1L9WIY1_ASPA1|nr:uncharacterized protein ASPACDRAFT_47442 [Aspergillus aculeatus ATCC 16872]OJJ96085.1 hypothetical protein ASPACDRAFT_47442 [Aspergillus aculeatus ATCC 16872]
MAETSEKLGYWAQCLGQIFPSHEGFDVSIESPRPTPSEWEVWSPYQKLMISHQRVPFLVFMVANPGSWQELEHSLFQQMMALGETPWNRRRGVIANGVLVRLYHFQDLRSLILRAIGDPSHNYFEDATDKAGIEKRLAFYKLTAQRDWLSQNASSP